MGKNLMKHQNMSSNDLYSKYFLYEWKSISKEYVKKGILFTLDSTQILSKFTLVSWQAVYQTLFIFGIYRVYETLHPRLLSLLILKSFLCRLRYF